MAPARKNTKKKVTASQVEVETAETEMPATNGAAAEQNGKKTENEETFVVPKKIARKGKQRTADEILASETSPDKPEELEIENDAKISEEEPATNGEKNEKKTKKPAKEKKETKAAKRGRTAKKEEETEQESPEKKAKITNEEKPKRGRRAKVAPKNDENIDQETTEELPIEEKVDPPTVVAKATKKAKKDQKQEVNGETTEKVVENETVVDAKKKMRNGRKKKNAE